ncbi:unnamed protein product, partial [Discosporangium mesarthrocarpum]
MINTTLVALGLVWCVITLARLFCIHMAGRGPGGLPLEGGGLWAGGMGPGVGGGGALGLSNSQISRLELTSHIPHKDFSSSSRGVDLEVKKGALKGGDGVERVGGVEEEGEEEGTTCAICLCDMKEGEQMRVLPCNHFYHASCVDVWLRQNMNCPVCKQMVSVQKKSTGSPGAIEGSERAPFSSNGRYM